MSASINNTTTDYSIVVPVYNSENIVRELVSRICDTMDELGASYEILLTDDCSSDNVWERIKEISSMNAKVHGLRLSNNFGQWIATLAGISCAKGKTIITIDDDMEYDPSDIKKLVATYSSTPYYIVFGIAPAKYELQGKSTLFSVIRNKAVNILWQKFLTDSFKIFNRNLVFKDGIHFSPKIHFEAFITHTLHSRYVGYCDVSYHPRFHGKSNHTLYKKISIFFQYSLEYYKYPSKGLSLLLALILLISMACEYFFFKGRLNGLLLAVIGLVEVCILLLILQYSAYIYMAEKEIPLFWIIERTPTT